VSEGYVSVRSDRQILGTQRRERPARLPPALLTHLLFRFQALPLAEGGDMFPCVKGMRLARAEVIRGHPKDCCLGVREDRHPSQGVAPAGGHSQCLGNGCVLGVVGFLLMAHVHLVTLPLLSLLLGHGVAARTRVCQRTVREGRQPRRLRVFCGPLGCFLIVDGVGLFPVGRSPARAAARVLRREDNLSRPPHFIYANPYPAYLLPYILADH
jgi:hypothetical protein